ncbi:N-acetylmuramic acid 6-phosphate etherase [Paenibacillus sp. J31TS4]|uniref:N-acetylmuramic acid 6-phosphate etherase n=1 Tax=Paenibacillus sp. J31TS4 TaxID=2807195 RepID=UPI001B02EDBE|nr:N-acetylmuramic acid 6-phosphate etherase [Paenibacillus sp. J31TS4]GIP40363.1 N-acetylmuramic acid 6-phosphate etherase [Paenibacillus sp. J31TS4]
MEPDVQPNVLTEQRNENTTNLDQLSIQEIVEAMNREDQKVAHAVEEAVPAIAAAIEAIVERMEQGGRLFYIGAGTSGRLGVLDASECPPTFGVPRELVTGIIAGGPTALQNAIENAEDDPEAGARDVAAQITDKDALVGIAANGGTPYVLGAIRKAQEIGAVTAGISCNKDTKLSAEAEYPIELLVGPEAVTGSTRLKAGTATKMALNMITTTAMIKLGKVYGNLMVNVQATNAKLRDRVVRIIAQATGCDLATAEEMNKRADGDARVGILMLKFGVQADEARRALRVTNDHFGRAVELLEQQAAAASE